MSNGVALFLAALAMDLFLGEPPSAVHPVVWMGHAIRTAARAVKTRQPLGQTAAGVGIALAIPALFGGGAALVLYALRPWPLPAFLISVWLLKSSFALRALGRAARRVRDALYADRLDEGRAGLTSLCSRDPSRLDRAQLVAATIESVAENASDSFVAPLFYYVIAGVPGALAYRAINTLDAMIGYHGHYEWLGKAAARLDDVANFVPARLTAALLVAAGWLAGFDARSAVRVWRRDARTTESPNAGRPMAAMAGLLSVELRKWGHYRLGDPIDTLTVAKIDRAWSAVRIAATLATLICIGSVYALRH